MKYKKEADYLKFCSDIKEKDFWILVEEAVKTKESYQAFVKNLKHWCRANRRNYILKLHRFYKDESSYEDAAESVSSNTGWKLNQIKKILSNQR